MRKKIILILSILIKCLGSCKSSYDKVYISELISTKGEKIYILSTIWGVTGDYQLSTITKNKNKFNDIEDTIGCIEGLNPFEYKFKNDTLTLFFRNDIKYFNNEVFETIFIKYEVMNIDYVKSCDTSFHLVPDIEADTIPNMPKPPK